MGEVPLARLWQLPDGTSCLLLKDSHAHNWQVRVLRGRQTLRTEIYGSPIAAMEEAKQWRAMYDRSVHAAG
jgi:hypothetical protein